MRKALITIILILSACIPLTVHALPYIGSTTREYTQQNPLVYVDAWEKWPYAFINDDGEPDGFNVEVVRIMAKRLNIPCTIRLCSQADAHSELQTGKADLSFGVNAGYNAEFGRFGKEPVCYFENALVQYRADSVGPYKLEQLRDIPFCVKKNSRAFYFVMNNGFSDTLVTAVDNVGNAVLKLSIEKRGAVLWNTMMLKWLVNKYHLTDLAISSVDIPPGPYCFMSGDTILLNKLDSLCAIMKEEGEIDRLMTDWMYPERKTEDNTYIYIIESLLVVLVFTILLLYGIRYYRKYYSRNTLYDINSQMGLVLESNHMQVWVYYPLTRRYAWMTRDGKVNQEFASFDFSRFYPDQDFNIIHSTVMDFLSKDMDPVVKTLRSYSLRDPKKILNVEVLMQVLKDDYGKIYLICGVQHDITDSKALLERMRTLHMRHKVTFDIALGAMLRFDGEGRLVDINFRSHIRMGIVDKEKVLSAGYNFRDFCDFHDIDIDDMPDDFCFTAFFPNADVSLYAPITTAEGIGKGGHKRYEMGYYYAHVVKSNDADGKLQSIMMFITDVSDDVNRQRQLQRRKRHVAVLESDTQLYQKCRDQTLKSYKMRLIRYRPDTKMLSIYDYDEGKEHTFSQLRVLELINSSDMKKVFHVYHHLDSRGSNDIHLEVATMLHNGNGDYMHFCIDVHPVYDHKGCVESYFGICRDITAEYHLHQQLKTVTKRSQEAEHLRQTFLRNMSYSIRQPLISIRNSIENLLNRAATLEDVSIDNADASATSVDARKEAKYLQNIIGNTQHLIRFSDDTLYLSRIEAGLLVPNKESMDFAELFRQTVEQTISKYRREGITYNVENMYKAMRIEGDAAVLSRIIQESVALSVRFMQYGTCNVRYFMHNGQLSIAVNDNGGGIPPAVYAHIFDQQIVSTYVKEDINVLSGLEMPICKALVELLNGTIEVESEPGSGTSVFINIPVTLLESPTN